MNTVKELRNMDLKRGEEPQMKSRMNILRDMIIFVEVGRRENFTQAARALGMPLSTVARRISSLEKEIGLLLIERTTRQQSLTASGRKYFERCRHVVDDALAAYDDIHSETHGLAGQIKVALPPDISPSFFAKTITLFLREHGSVKVSVSMASKALIPGDEVDLLISIGEPQIASMVTRRVGSVPLYLYVSDEYMKGKKEFVIRSDLNSQDIIIANVALPYADTLLRDLSSLSVNSGGRLSCESFEVTVSMALLGQGVVLLPHEVARPYIISGSLRPVLYSWSPVILPIYSVMARKLISVRLRTFVNFIVKGFPSDLPATGVRDLQSA